MEESKRGDLAKGVEEELLWKREPIKKKEKKGELRETEKKGDEFKWSVRQRRGAGVSGKSLEEAVKL